MPDSQAQSILHLTYSAKTRRALHLAERAHRGTSRRTGDHPYVLHPVVAAQIGAAAGADEEVICALYLHDVPEDTTVTIADIAEEFGTRVARLVAGVTKHKFDANGVRIGHVEQAAQAEQKMQDEEDIDVVFVKGCDLTANITDLLLDQRYEGYAHWRDLFGERAEAKLGHYLRLGAIIVKRLEAADVYPLLAETLSERCASLAHLLDAWPSAPSSA
jgi:(p)ppGpp synthase/HD superfamily hydrolase